jgi:transglutaminase/protease-like cytokinesis protein 3
MELHQYLEAGAKNEQEKIRAFYFWIVRNITYKDKRELLFDEDLLFYMGSNNCSSPVCVLARKQAVCEGFSNLFQYFCSQSGFEAYSVGGYISKNGAFQDRATHSWNAVRVE